MKVELMDMVRVRKSIDYMEDGEIGVIVDEDANPRLKNTIVIKCPNEYIYNFNLGLVDDRGDLYGILVDILPKGTKIQIIVEEV
jgi:hypothetical protein